MNGIPQHLNLEVRPPPKKRPTLRRLTGKYIYFLESCAVQNRPPGDKIATIIYSYVRIKQRNVVYKLMMVSTYMGNDVAVNGEVIVP